MTVDTPVSRPGTPAESQASAPTRSPSAPRLAGSAPPAKASADRFAMLLAAYRDAGGCARGEEVARRFEDLRRGDYVSLARQIARGEVLGYEWRGDLWIPLFQFEPSDLSVREGLRCALAELRRGRIDGWTFAAWFVTGHAALAGRRPVDVLAADPRTVLAAAASAFGPLTSGGMKG